MVGRTFSLGGVCFTNASGDDSARNISTGAVTITPPTTLSAALTYGGVTLSNAVSGTGNMALTAGTTFTGTTTMATLAATTINAFTLGGGITAAGNNITGVGILTASSFNGNGWTTGTGTLTFTGTKTLTVNNSIALTGTDATTMTFPTTSATIARTDAGQTFTGTQTFGTISPTTINAFTAGGAIAMGANNITGGGTATFTTFIGALTGHASLDCALSGCVIGTSITPTTSVPLTVNGGMTVTPPATGVAVVPVAEFLNTDGTPARIYLRNFGTGGQPTVNYFSARGTAASPTAIQSGDTLGSNFGIGYATSGGAGYVTGAGGGFSVQATDNYTSTVAGAKFNVFSTPTGTASSIVSASFGGGLFMNGNTDQGIGTINATTYYGGGTKGVTCSGPLTVVSSITIKAGIVTAASGTGGTCS